MAVPKLKPACGRYISGADVKPFWGGHFTILKGFIMPDLKPCPFCGSEAKVLVSEKDHPTYQIIGCSEPSMLCPNPSMVVYQDGDSFHYEHWNNRAGSKEQNSDSVQPV